MSPHAAIAADCAGFPFDPDPLGKVRTERERLTPLLRSLAAGLDELDRRIGDLAWQRAGTMTAAARRTERTALEAQRRHLDSRLRLLAGHLQDLDHAMSVFREGDQWPQARVGTCPDCGYPSLESRLCATCRSHLAGPGPLGHLNAR